MSNSDLETAASGNEHEGEPVTGTTTSLDEEIVAALRRIIRAIDLHSRDLLQQYGMTTPQLVTLREVVRAQPVSAGALASGVHVSQATMTGILDRLERRKLVTRVRATEDRRSVVITATEEGLKFARSAPSLLQDRFRQELGKMEQWEQTSMLSVLQRIAEMMGAQDLPAAPILTDGADPLLGADEGGETSSAGGRRKKKKAATRRSKNGK